jgi:choline dehydrogenase-like flavoprotein
MKSHETWLGKTVRSIVQTFIEETTVPSPHCDPDKTTGFVLGQMGRMPDFLKGPLIFLTLTFDLVGLIKGNSLFRRLPLSGRIHQLNRWRQSYLAPCRNLIRFYDTLIIAAWAGDLSGEERDSKGEIPPFVLTSPIRHQVAVIGSGPGGAVTATMLAEQGLDVVIIEEGKNRSLESCVPFSLQEMIQKYRNGGITPALGRTNVAYVEGNCFGGGSEINSGLYHRTPSEILEKWRKDFLLKADEEELRPHFQACETDLSVGLTRGNAPPASLKLHEGAMKLGWKSLEVPRWFAYYGTLDRSGIPMGKRQSMTETYLKRFSNAGGRIIPSTRCFKIRKDASGFQLLTKSTTGSGIIHAERVFCSAGAIGTPALLHRSGILGKIGRGLQMHPTIKVVAEFDEEVNTEEMGVPVHQVKEFAPSFSFGCSISSLPYLAMALLDHPAQMVSLDSSWRRMAVYYAMIVPQGRGTVQVLPGCRDPLVRFHVPDEDLRMLSTALKKLGQLLFAAGAKRLYPGISSFGSIDSAADLNRIPLLLPPDRTALMSIHLFSTCPMGEDKSRCPIDSLGRVRGINGLHIADASMLPSAPGVNPQGTIMALARRNALCFASHLNQHLPP